MKQNWGGVGRYGKVRSTSRLEFKAQDDDLVCDVKGGSYRRSLQGIKPSDFVQIYEWISSKYNLFVSDEFPTSFSEEKTAFGKKQKVQVSSVEHLINFVLNARYLLEKHIEIQPLIKEFQNIADIRDLRHTCSVSFVASIYAHSGYGISFPVSVDRQR